MSATERDIKADLDPDIVRALHWCRLGRTRPHDPIAFHRAKQMGLLAQDSVWRTTEQGDGVLIALGYLEGGPAPQRTIRHVLWAVSDQYPTPHYVGSLSDWQIERGDLFDQLKIAWCDEVQADYPIEWRFFETTEWLDLPPVPEDAL